MRIKLYIPTQMSGFEGCLEHAQQQLAERFGGFTSMTGTGGWTDQNGNVVQEPVTVIEAYGDITHGNAVIFMDSVVEYIMGYNNYDESEIMYVVGQQQYCVKSADGDRIRVTA